jgi:hypothetical protein
MELPANALAPAHLARAQRGAAIKDRLSIFAENLVLPQGLDPFA